MWDYAKLIVPNSGLRQFFLFKKNIKTKREMLLCYKKFKEEQINWIDKLMWN